VGALCALKRSSMMTMRPDFVILAATDGEKIKITFNSSSFKFKIYLKLFLFCCLKLMYSNFIDLNGGRFQVVCPRAHITLATPLYICVCMLFSPNSRAQSQKLGAPSIWRVFCSVHTARRAIGVNLLVNYR